MAAKKKEEVPAVQEVQRYKGWQLLRMQKYKTRVARVVLNVDEVYSFEEADKLIFNFMKKKG